MQYLVTHDVIWLQVTVHNVEAVQVPKSSGEIVGNEKSLDP